MARKRANKENFKRAQQEKKKRTTSGKYDLGDSDVDYFSPKKGNMSLVIVPYDVTVKNHPDRVPVGDIWCRMPVKIHYNVGIEEQSYICPKTFGRRCPICEDRARLLSEARTEEEKEIAKKLKPQERELYNIVDLDNEDAGVQFWDVALGNFGDLLEEEIEAGQEKYDGFYDPDEPYSIEVRFKQESFNGNKFLKASKIDFEEMDPMPDEWLEEAIALDKAPIVLDYSELQAIYLGLDTEDLDEDGDEPEEKPARSRKRSRRKKDDEEKPARSRRKSSRKKKEPEPDTDNSEDEGSEEPGDEPEEKPTRSRRKSSRKKKEEPKEEPEEKPARSRKRGGKKKETDGPECPGGGTFGNDFDTFDECDDCEFWNDCADKFDELNG